MQDMRLGAGSIGCERAAMNQDQIEDKIRGFWGWLCELSPTELQWAGEFCDQWQDEDYGPGGEFARSLEEHLRLMATAAQDDAS